MTKEQAILDAASELFLQRGFNAVSIGEIMKRAGCSRETVYRYFSGKEDIFANIISHQMDSYLDTMRSVITTVDAEDLRDGLIDWSLSLLKSVTDDKYIQFRRLIISEMNARPEHGRLYYDLTYSKGANAVAEFFKLFQKKRKLKAVNADRLASHFVGMLLYHVMHTRVLGIRKKPSQAQMKKLAIEVVDDFLLGYAPGYAERG